MTSTNFHVGLTESTRNSSKVLKPPGGGSSDIFGSNPPSTPRSVRNHMTSNIFSAPDDARNANGESARRKPSQDSHNRLFGEADRVVSPSKPYKKSNIPIGDDAVDSTKLTNGNGKICNGHALTNGNGNANGNGVAIENHKGQNGVAAHVNGGTNGIKSDGNPVTGEGYNRGAAEINTTVPSLNGAKQVINKNRIPPGGFSSGLW